MFVSLQNASSVNAASHISPKFFGALAWRYAIAAFRLVSSLSDEFIASMSSQGKSPPALAWASMRLLCASREDID